MTPFRPAKTQRDLLIKLGIGHFNATQIIPYMMTQPATTDPRSPAVMLLVRAIQTNLWKMGASEVPNSGYLDRPTADALTRLFGGDERWINMTWAQVTGAVVTGVANHVQLGTIVMPVEAPPIAAGGFGDGLFGEPASTVLKWGGAIALGAWFYKDIKKMLK